eukprot:750331-Hanusia_phi.AAC.1
MHTDSDVTGNILVMGIRVDTSKSTKEKPTKIRTIFIAQLSKDGKIVESDDIPLNPRHVPVAFTVLKSGAQRNKAIHFSVLTLLQERSELSQGQTLLSPEVHGSELGQDLQRWTRQEVFPSSHEPGGESSTAATSPIPHMMMRFSNVSSHCLRVGCPSRRKTGKIPRKMLKQKDNPTAPPRGVSLARASKFRGGDLSTVSLASRKRLTTDEGCGWEGTNRRHHHHPLPPSPRLHGSQVAPLMCSMAAGGVMTGIWAMMMIAVRSPSSRAPFSVKQLADLPLPALLEPGGEEGLRQGASSCQRHWHGAGCGETCRWVREFCAAGSRKGNEDGERMENEEGRRRRRRKGGRQDEGREEEKKKQGRRRRRKGEEGREE